VVAGVLTWQKGTADHVLPLLIIIGLVVIITLVLAFLQRMGRLFLAGAVRTQSKSRRAPADQSGR
jgi:hypothetical protein